MLLLAGLESGAVNHLPFPIDLRFFCPISICTYSGILIGQAIRRIAHCAATYPAYDVRRQVPCDFVASAALDAFAKTAFNEDLARLPGEPRLRDLGKKGRQHDGRRKRGLPPDRGGRAMSRQVNSPSKRCSGKTTHNCHYGFCACRSLSTLGPGCRCRAMASKLH